MGKCLVGNFKMEPTPMLILSKKKQHTHKKNPQYYCIMACSSCKIPDRTFHHFRSAKSRDKWSVFEAQKVWKGRSGLWHRRFTGSSSFGTFPFSLFPTLIKNWFWHLSVSRVDIPIRVFETQFPILVHHRRMLLSIDGFWSFKMVKRLDG